MTLTAYPQAFRVQGISKDGKHIDVLTGPMEIITPNGTYGGFGLSKQSWPIERVLTRREKWQLRSARQLERKDRANLMKVFHVRSAEELRASLARDAVANARHGIIRL